MSETAQPIDSAIEETKAVANQLADRVGALRTPCQEHIRIGQVRQLIADAQRKLAVVDGQLVDAAAGLPPRE